MSRFDRVPLSEKHQLLYSLIQNNFKDMEKLLTQSLTPTWSLDITLNKMEETFMWFEKALMDRDYKFKSLEQMRAEHKEKV